MATLFSSEGMSLVENVIGNLSVTEKEGSVEVETEGQHDKENDDSTHTLIHIHTRIYTYIKKHPDRADIQARFTTTLFSPS